MTEELISLLKDHSPRQKRALLIEKMDQLEQTGFGCEKCQGGWCCTFEYNSMRVSPLEAIDIYLALVEENKWNDELIHHLQHTQTKYRLDKEIFLGRGNTLRRTYTCPFFTEKAQGCSLSRAHKPYGCLAFNAQKSEVTDAGFCGSDQVLLEKQVVANQDDQINQLLKTYLTLDFDKKDIPSALLEINNQLINLSNSID